MTVTFHYDPNADQDPVLRFFDAKTGKFVVVAGSTEVADSYVVDKVNHTVTVVFDATSNPRPRDLNGTLFTLAVPAPPPPAPTPASTPPPALVFAPNLASPAVADTSSGASRTGVATTPLITNSEITLTLASSDSLRRGGSDSESGVTGPTLPPAIGFLNNLFDVRDVLVEAFRMWLEQPAPIVSPPSPVPAAQAPMPELADDINQPVLPAVVRTTSEPWWLTQQASATNDVDDESIPVAIPLEETSEPEKDVAVAMGLWIGSSALAAMAPIPEREEFPTERRRVRGTKRRWRTGGLDEVRR